MRNPSGDHTNVTVQIAMSSYYLQPWPGDTATRDPSVALRKDQLSSFSYSPPPCCRSALTRGGITIENHPKPQNFPLRGAKNPSKTSFLDVSEQISTTFFWSSVGNFCCETFGGCWLWCRMFRVYKNASLLFTKFIYKPHMHGSRRFHGCRNALVPFAKMILSYICAVPSAFTRVGTRLYYS